jgi:NAD(P)-dependent dehydrogenase (short-subunit alcohol dehydrogenase family)
MDQMNQVGRRVVVITGAGRGIGREYALEFARQGCAVVVNDLGGSREGTGSDASPAQGVVRELESMGAQAVANGSDVSTLAGAAELIDQAIDEFGTVDTLICNAGIIRDRALVNMSEEEWDSVIRVHLKGTFAPSQAVVRRWREETRAGGRGRAGRLITTSSSAGLFGNGGQSNYAAAKAGIAGFTLAVSHEVTRYGATANGVWPFARSRMTEDVLSGSEQPDGSDIQLDPAAIAPVVGWLGSAASQNVNGRFLGLRDSTILVAEGWRGGPRVDAVVPWTRETAGLAAEELIAASRPNAVFPMGVVPGTA